MKKRKKRRSQSRTAMVSITFVAGVLFLGMMGKSVALEKQLSSYDSQIKDLDRQIEEEAGRTTEIDELKEYMKTDEYVEETAREKLGLVNKNEIVFKEGDAEQGSQADKESGDKEKAQDTQADQNGEDARDVADAEEPDDDSSAEGSDTDRKTRERETSQDSRDSRNGNTLGGLGQEDAEEAEG